MNTVLDTLQLPARSPGPTLVRDFDIEFRLLEERITVRLQSRGLRGRLRAVLRGGDRLSPTG